MELTCEEKLKMMQQNRNLLHELLSQCCKLLTEEQIASIEAWPGTPQSCMLQSWIESK